MGEQAQVVNVTADAGLRAGVYSNYVGIQNQPGELVVDFCFLDGAFDEDGVTGGSGILVSRVVLNESTAIALRDSLGEAIERRISERAGR